MALRHQVALATSLLCFILVGTIATGAALVGRDQAMRNGVDYLSDIAATFADRLDWNLDNRIGFAEHLASLDALNRLYPDSRDGMRTLLNQARGAMSDTAWLGYATADGTIAVASSGLHEGQPVGHHHWFQRGLRTSVVVDPRSVGARGPAPAGATADIPVDRFVEIGVPVRGADGDVVGVVAMMLAPNWVDRLRAATVADIDSSRGIELAIVNEHGVVLRGSESGSFSLAAFDLAAMLDAPSGATVVRTDDGYLTVFAVSEAREGRPRWIAIARQAAATALAQANHIVMIVIVLGLAVGAAGVLGSILIAARVSAPFRRLADKAALIGRNTTQTIPRVRGSFEASRLSTVLRALVLRLSHAEQSTVDAMDRAAIAEEQHNRDITRLRNLADRDPLTELLNRRAFVQFGADAFEQYRRYYRPFAILMIDIDHFKRINDALGHATGDAAIRAVARILARTLRPSDKGARFGGEEFVALLREVSIEEAGEVAERLRSAIAAAPVAVGADGEFFVTVSVGVAVSNAADANVQAVIERADVALYEAKNRGRNVVVRADQLLEHVRRIA